MTRAQERHTALNSGVMRSAEYRVLEYARSEDVVKGVDFLVVLRLLDGTGPCLRAYILDTWKGLAANSDDRTTQDLGDFVYNLRQKLMADRSPMADGFFDLIGDLSVGPYRTADTGSLRFDDSDELSFLSPDRPGELVLLPEDTMKLLIGSIRSS